MIIFIIYIHISYIPVKITQDVSPIVIVARSHITVKPVSDYFRATTES